MGFVGSDAEALEQLSRECGLQARRLRDRQRRVSAVLVAAPWTGRDADGFRQEWSRSHRPQLERVAAGLEAVAAALLKQASQQRQASRADGSSGSSLHPALLAPVAVRWPRSETLRDPAAVARWWSSLSPAERESLLSRDPARIGSLDGVPGWARDKANRVVIASELERLKQEKAKLDHDLSKHAPSFMPEGKLRNAVEGAFTNEDRRATILQAKIDALELLQAYKQDRQILLVDTSGERVRAAVAVGNVDTAQNIAISVPGLSSNVEEGMAGYVSDASHLRAMVGDPEQAKTAVVVWVGYEAPQWKDSLGSGSVASSGTAEEAAPQLRSFVEGLDVGREDSVRKVVIGHSYGSLVTGLALEGGGHSVDAVIFQGSPGIGVDEVADLGVPQGEVYAAEADWDGIGDLARFSEDPNRMDGVTVLETDPDGQHSGSTWHSSYLKEDSTSLYNAARVLAGDTDQLIVDGQGNSGLGDLVREGLTPRLIPPWHPL